MKLNTKILKEFDKNEIKNNSSDFKNTLNYYIKKYGLVRCKKVKSNYDEMCDLDEAIPSYGDFRSYLAMLAGSELTEFPIDSKVREGAIIFAKNNGFKYIKEIMILTKKK